MCRTCAFGEYTVLKNGISVHIFCADFRAPHTALWKSTCSSSTIPHIPTQTFATIKSLFLPPLMSAFSTLSTRPITRTINEMKVM
jgi:hypothetical protein